MSGSFTQVLLYMFVGSLLFFVAQHYAIKLYISSETSASRFLMRNIKLYSFTKCSLKS